MGIPIGNIAYMLALRLTSDQKQSIQRQGRYQMTPLGILDTQTNHLIHTDKELEQALEELKSNELFI
ncbi:MAG: hypothetical protein HY400_05055 [Elusimicrobia bacterium]|nr:hypothetical protein [Elusimicrobiota bacterium]